MKLTVFFLFALTSFCVIATTAQKKMANSKRLNITHITEDLLVDHLNSAVWDKASDVAVTKYWSGLPAPATRQFKARLLWSDMFLYVRFEASQSEPLVVSESADLTKKVRGLWDRDVCEIFIAPDNKNRNKYFEFEIAPNGEWIDLGIEVTPSKRLTDWDYASGMKSATFIEDEKVVMAIKIPFSALGKMPKVGDIWLGNLFRCVGKDPTRGYLGWQPTMTNEPSFHVPSAFGEFKFVR